MVGRGSPGSSEVTASWKAAHLARPAACHCPGLLPQAWRGHGRLPGSQSQAHGAQCLWRGAGSGASSGCEEEEQAFIVALNAEPQAWLHFPLPPVWAGLGSPACWDSYGPGPSGFLAPQNHSRLRKKGCW